jgi:type IV secretion system protein VirB6
MLSTCPGLASGDAFLGSLLQHIDCQGRTLGLSGYEALAAPGSPIGLVLTSVLVIFVALFGLRLASGEATLRDAVIAVVKIGIVLTLATNWPAFQVVVYDVVVDGPAQVGQALGLSPDTGGADPLINRLQGADQAIIRLTNIGTGREDFTVLPSAAGALSGEAAQRFPISDNPAFGWARVIFLSSSVAAFAVVRLTAGLLLALTPLFAALLLFDMAKGLFVGWVRALVFTCMGSVALVVVFGVELALLEPWLNETTSLRRAGGVVASAPVELLVLCLGFAVALTGSLGLLLRMSFMVQAPRHNPISPAGAPTAWAMPAPTVATTSSERLAADPPPSRALVVADAVASAQRRESSRSFASAGVRAAAAATSAPMQGAVGPSDDLVIPNFGPAGRRSRPRTSLGARLRDHRS